jgi:hypothetical protein
MCRRFAYAWVGRQLYSCTSHIRMSLKSFFVTAETKDIDVIVQAAKAVAVNNQELREAKQKLLLTQLRQQQVNAQAEAAKVAKQMAEIETEMAAQKALDRAEALTQSTEILQACVDEMVDTDPKVWVAIEGAPLISRTMMRVFVLQPPQQRASHNAVLFECIKIAPIDC